VTSSPERVTGASSADGAFRFRAHVTVAMPWRGPERRPTAVFIVGSSRAASAVSWSCQRRRDLLRFVAVVVHATRGTSSADRTSLARVVTDILAPANLAVSHRTRPRRGSPDRRPPTNATRLSTPPAEAPTTRPQAISQPEGALNQDNLRRRPSCRAGCPEPTPRCLPSVAEPRHRWQQSAAAVSENRAWMGACRSVESWRL
jgi:hypothetical protein